MSKKQNEKQGQKRETSWCILTFDNIKNQNDINNTKKESLDIQDDNIDNDDYAWEDM